MDMLDNCLTAGVSIFDFWEMTYGEAYMVVKNYIKKKEAEQKQAIVNNYQLASLISVSVNCALAGKRFPELDSLYPDLFPKTADDLKKQGKLYSEAFIAAAEEYNHKYNKKLQAQIN